jgi:hypothetical protein
MPREVNMAAARSAQPASGAMANPKAQPGFFKTVFEELDSDSERILVEVNAVFPSKEILEEVRWRLDVLKEISANPELVEASTGLKNQLTKIFTAGGDEAQVLQQLRELTEVDGADGVKLDLRRFVKRAKRSFAEPEYREILAKKLENTRLHMTNLIAFYPDANQEMQKLTQVVQELHDQLADAAVRTSDIKDREDKLRETTSFHVYEDLKSRFLKDWLARFTSLSEAEIAGLSHEEIQKLIQEHHRHQISQLVKTKVTLVEMDMTEHLGLHDTLEAEFKDAEFWKNANTAAKTGFRHWVLSTVQAFGMLKGQRYTFFQNLGDKEQYLLFGLGVSSLPTNPAMPMLMIPYIKPFTRKANYLLEIRKREIGDAAAYYHELAHYVMPFLFAFDQMKEFKIAKDLLAFFNTRYE